MLHFPNAATDFADSISWGRVDAESPALSTSKFVTGLNLQSTNHFLSLDAVTAVLLAAVRRFRNTCPAGNAGNDRFHSFKSEIPTLAPHLAEIMRGRR